MAERVGSYPTANFRWSPLNAVGMYYASKDLHDLILTLKFSFIAASFKSILSSTSSTEFRNRGAINNLLNALSRSRCSGRAVGVIAVRAIVSVSAYHVPL